MDVRGTAGALTRTSHPDPTHLQQIYALGALALALLLHLNVLRTERGSRESLATEEITALGADILQTTFDQLAGVPFDANDADALGALTLASQFGGASWATAADLDDFHGANTTVHVPGPTGTGTLAYRLSARVEYVSKAGNAWAPSSARTWFKRVTVTLDGPLETRATVERVFTSLRV